MFSDSIEIRPRVAGARGPRGNVSYSWPEGSYFTLEGVGVAPATSNETDTAGRALEVTTGLEVYSEQYNVPVKAHDRAFYDGTEWQVLGRVARWRDPFTMVDMGSVFRLEAVTDESL